MFSSAPLLFKTDDNRLQVGYDVVSEFFYCLNDVVDLLVAYCDGGVCALSGNALTVDNFGLVFTVEILDFYREIKEAFSDKEFRILYLESTINIVKLYLITTFFFLF